LQSLLRVLILALQNNHTKINIMKNLFITLSLIIFVFSSCEDKVTETVTYKINEPIFMPEATFRSSVKVSPQPQAINVLGKMCFYNGY